MDTKNKKLLLVILPILIATIVGASILMYFTLRHVHEFSEWEIVEEPTCTHEGKRIRTCVHCQDTEEEILPLMPHQYTDIKNTWINDTNYIECVCSACGSSTGSSIEGGYSSETSTVYLYNCPTDFSFEIVCADEEEYIRNNLTIVESMFSNYTGDDLLVFSDEYKLSQLNENVWSVSPVNPYFGRTGYAVLLGENISLASFPEKQLQFRTVGNESNIVVFDDQILFLQKLEEENPGYYPYSVQYALENSQILLTVSQQGVFNDEMIGKIICIGDCANMEEAATLPSNQVDIGRIESIETASGETVVTLGPVGIEDVYSQLDITLGDKQPVVIEDFTQSEKVEYVHALLWSQPFQTVATDAFGAAESYALEIGGTSVEADWEGFIADLLGSLGISKEDMPTNNPKDHKIKINIGTVRGDAGVDLTIKIKRNRTTISTVKLSITIKKEIIISMDGSVTKNNIKEFIGDKFNFFNDDDVVAHFYTEIVETDVTTLKTGISLSFELDSETVYYVVTPNTKKIHSCSCVYASGYDSDDDVYHTFAQIKEKFGSSYKEYQCKKCIPFSDSKFFGVNKETGVVHCMGGQCVENMDLSKIYQCVFLPKEGDIFSGNKKYTYCSTCEPLRKAESSEAGVAYSFDDYINDGFKEGNWDTEFKFLSKFAFEKLGIDDSRDVDFDKTKSIAIWGIVELRLGVYPIVEIEAKVSANLNYVDVVKKKYVIEIRYDSKTKETYKDIHAEELALSAEEKGLTEFTIDVKGSIDAKIGVRGVIAVGITGVGKWFNINLTADIGAFVRVNGMIHLNLRDSEKNENFNCGYGQLGLFVKLSAGGTVAGIQFTLKDFLEEEIPLLSVGDSIIYYGYCDYEQVLELKNQNSYKIDSELLSVVIYDLEKQEKKFDELNPSGEKGEYSVSYKFVDNNGNNVKYCSVKDGVLYIDSSAPSTFEINMIVTVVDTDPVGWDDVFDSGLDDTLGTSYQLPELTIKISYERTNISNSTTTDSTNTTNDPENSEGTGKISNFPTLTYLYNTGDSHRAIGEYLQAALKNAGITMNLEAQDWATFLNTRKDGDYAIARNGWLADYNDPICFLDMWTSGSGNNDVQFGRGDHANLKMYSIDLTPYGSTVKVKNGTWAETYDVLISEIKACPNETNRYAMMHLAEDMLMDTGCIVPLYFYTDVYMVSSNVKGLFSNPLGYKHLMNTTIQGGSDTLDVCFGPDPYALDPSLNTSVDSANMLTHLFSGLAKWSKDASGKLVIVPDLATELPKGVKNKDGTVTYTYTLKDNLTWSNGDALTAADFVFAWNRAASAELSADYGYMFQPIVGYEDVALGKEGAKLAVEAVDKKTLKVTIATSASYWNELLAFPTYYPVHKATVANENWATSPKTYVCNGPYTISDWKHNSVITLTKNDKYHDKNSVTMPTIKAHLSEDANNMLANYKNGSWLLIDDVPTNEIATLKKTHKDEIIVAGQMGTYYVCWNINEKILPADSTLTGVEAEKAQAEIRKAIGLLFNRDYIVNDVYMGGLVPASSFVAMGMTNPDGTQFYKTANSTTDSFDGYYNVAPEAFESNVASAMKILNKYYKPANAPSTDSYAKVGDYIKFGSYEQDNDKSNGREDIEWLVLEVKDGKALVISKYALDCEAYNSSFSDVTWETCTLRRWLNGTFINSAFSADERAMIPTVTVSADKNPEYRINQGNATQDQVFLLSITEVNRYFSSDNARQCKPTAYAISNAAGASSRENGYCSWLLRSIGYTQTYAAYVFNDGAVNSGGSHAKGIGCVRPAMWIDLSKMS